MNTKKINIFGNVNLLIKVVVLLSCYLFLCHYLIIEAQTNNTAMIVTYLLIFLLPCFTYTSFIGYAKKCHLHSDFSFGKINHKVWLSVILLFIINSFWKFSIFGLPHIAIPKFLIDFVCGCLCAPIFEEIFFRGYIQTTLSKRYSPLISILLTTLAFTLFHYPYVNKMIVACIYGIFIGFIYHQTGKLSICIVYHSMFNFIGAFMFFDDILNNIWILIALVTTYVLVLFDSAFGLFYNTKSPLTRNCGDMTNIKMLPQISKRTILTIRQWGSFVAMRIIGYLLIFMALAAALGQSYIFSLIMLILAVSLTLVWFKNRINNAHYYLIKSIISTRLIHKKQIFLAILLCMAYYVLVFSFYGTRRNPFLETASTGYLIINAIVIIICNPITQVLLFNGFMQEQLLKRLHPWLTIIIVSITLCLPHLFIIPKDTVSYFIFSLFVCVIYNYTKNIVLCMIFFASLFIGFPIKMMINPAFELSIWSSIPLAVFAIALSVFAIKEFAKGSHAIKNNNT